MCHRALVFFVVALAACAAPPRAPTPTPRHAFTVTYREAGSAFAIVDALALQKPEKPDSEYGDDWKKRYGTDAAEQTQLAAWAEVRARLKEKDAAAAPEDDAILIGRAKAPDRLAAIFYAESDLEVALTRSKTLVDADVLRATFALLKPKLDPLLAEARKFAAIAPKLQARLDDPRIGAFVAEVTRFYRVNEVPPFTVELVWWPPTEDTTANLVGDTLLLRYNPQKDAAAASADVDVALHEVVHFVSQRQPEEQKRSLSRAFMAKCTPPPNVGLARLFEEPLAVAHQKMFLAQNDPAHFDRERSWYGDPWASISAKMIYDSVVDAHAQGRVLDERIAFGAGRSCRELSALLR